MTINTAGLRPRLFAAALLFATLTAHTPARCHADPTPPTGPGQIVTSNPIGPLITLAGSALFPLLRFGPGAVVLNARYHRSLSPALGLTVTPTIAIVHAIYRATTFGVKAGPRWTFRDAWLSGWYVHPSAHLGWIRAARLDGSGARSGISAGLSVEGGYTWAWQSGFVLELGLGMGWSAAIPLGDGDTVSGPRPGLNIGLGYGW